MTPCQPLAICVRKYPSPCNLDLNAQLKTLAEEKQAILDQIAAHQQNEEQQAIQAARRREIEEWLDRQPMCLTEYDDCQRQ